MAMNFKENKPIYQQIADRICDDVLLGTYCAGERIPSVREYAAIVEVNANTVMRTFDMLEKLEFIYNKRGIGFFVSENAKDLILQMRRKSFVEDEAEYFFRQLMTLGIDGDALSLMYKEYCDKFKK